MSLIISGDAQQRCTISHAFVVGPTVVAACSIRGKRTEAARKALVMPSDRSAASGPEVNELYVEACAQVLFGGTERTLRKAQLRRLGAELNSTESIVYLGQARTGRLLRAKVGLLVVAIERILHLTGRARVVSMDLLEGSFVAPTAKAAGTPAWRRLRALPWPRGGGRSGCSFMPQRMPQFRSEIGGSMVRACPILGSYFGPRSAGRGPRSKAGHHTPGRPYARWR